MEERPRIDVVVPVYNEADTIEAVLDEMVEALSIRVEPRFIVCEGGSDDDTLERLNRCAQRHELTVVGAGERKSYSQALRDGLRRARSDHVLVLDADGQCDPRDFPSLWRERHTTDIVIAWRRPRADSLARRLSSRAFGAVYGALFSPPVHDPSCPYALLERARVLPLLDGIGHLPYGFWWELVARAHRSGVRVREVPIRHRSRRSGQTRVFTPGRTPKLAVSHLLGLARLWWEIR